MGRKADTPEMQAAKGNPGRRRNKVEQRLVELERLAALLAAAPAASQDTFAPPILVEREFAPALEIWKRLAAEMVRTNRLPLEGRDYFAALCVYTAEYWELAVDVARNGKWQRVKRTNGSYEEKPRPAVAFRDAAYQNMLKLSERFGMTPLDMYALYKDQRLAAQANPGLFGRQDDPEQRQSNDDEQPGGLLGSAARLRSAPPAGTA